jgi:RNA-directed DNA polymerase
LGIPTGKDRTIQRAVKVGIEPWFEADLVPCSLGFRPEKTPRLALSMIAEKTQAGYTHGVDVDLKSYCDTISHELLLEWGEGRVGEGPVVGLIRAGLKAGVLEEGRVTHPDRGSPQGGVVSPLLSHILLHEVDGPWCRGDGTRSQSVVLVR